MEAEVINEEVEFPEEDRVYLEEGVWMEGDVIVIDVGYFEENQPDVEVSSYDQSIDTYASSYPTEVWSWSNDEYFGNYSISPGYTHTYSQYLFTGSNRYNVNVYGTRDQNFGSTVYAIEQRTKDITDNGYVVDEFSNLEQKTLYSLSFVNCDPSKEYAFAIRKAKDNSTLEGYIEVWI